jgi:two-component system, chemotaxis family, protein-glutamate methylesterase/glutaminase
MKVLIVEDDAVSLVLLKKVLRKQQYEIVTARNGAEAFNILRREAVDAVLTDWMMPEMDGMELLEKIRANVQPAPLLMMVTALASPQARQRALEAGADIYVTKPIDAAQVVDALQKGLAQKRQGHQYERLFKDASAGWRGNIVGVGITASTGGPPMVRELLRGITPTTAAAFFIVQHGPAWMLEAFVTRLQDETTMPVRLARHDMTVDPGTVYLAPGDVHMVVDPRHPRLHLIDDPPENYVRPAADPLFRSMAAAFRQRTLAVVLTGMGRDGTIGAGYVNVAGGVVIAQDPATATVASMPQSVVALRIARSFAPVPKLATEINQLILELQRAVVESN